MTALLTLEGVRAGYGEAEVLGGISLELEAGRSLALLGRNGTGKTTLINTIVGATDLMGGKLAFDGQDMTRLPGYRRAAAGIGWVPQERNIFASLTVEENLTSVARPPRGGAAGAGWDLQRVYRTFPRRAERKANMGNQLSGGEQQMLAMGRALMLNPRLLLLDEPLEGLAPIIVEELLAIIGRLIADEGMAVILVEQSAQLILPFTDDAIILERGLVVHQAPSAELAEDEKTIVEYLGVG
jgi:branched-chain amino acid transport system ATP-binding protein